MSTKFLFPIVLGLSLLTPHASASTFFNGSFETPGLGAGVGTIFGAVTGVEYVGNTTFSDGSWTHKGAADPDHQTGDFYTNGNGAGWTITPHDGNRYFGFGASGYTGGILSQTFDTIVGETYRVTYWLTTQEREFEPFPEQVAYVEAIDAADVVRASVTNTFAQGAGWFQGLSLSFVATSSTTTLRFTDQSAAAQSGEGTFLINWGLDDVSVTPTPEPGAFVLLSFGLVLIAVFRRRQQAR